MNPIPKIILLLFALIIQVPLFSQNAFVENKGQWPQVVEYKMSSTLHQVYFESDAFTFNLIDGEALFGSSVHHGQHHISRKASEKVNAHAYQMHFIDANPLVELEGRHRHAAYENYYIGKDQKNWASNVGRYDEIYYHEIYSSIDMKVHWAEQGFKYDFIVKPGGSVDEIQMEFVGVNRFTLTDGDLKVVTSVGKIIEQKPYVYQFIKGKQVEIKAEYVLDNKILSYRLLEPYNEKYDLIIDPELIFSTYSGAITDNWGFTATSDQLGNVYSGGIIFNSGYPTTLGAYQYDFSGPSGMSGYFNSDITISKYTQDGSTLLWASYLGGSESGEMPHSLVVNQFNDLIVFGTSGSSDYPVSADAYDTSFNGGSFVDYDNVIHFEDGSDIIITRLSSSGTQLIGSTFVGGTGNDGINWRNYYPSTGNDSLYYNYGDGARGEVIVDSKSDIFVGTSTFSNDFPTANGFQLNSNGMQEGIVFKLSADLTELVWSSYIGGSHDDAIYSLEINKYGETYVAGGTVSDNFPTSTNAYNTTFNGGTADGFVSHISSNGSQLLASTYFGSDAYDQAYFVRRDRFANVFITGQTKASGSTLIQNAVYNTPNSGQFIAKLLPGLQTLDWSTTFGTGNGKPNISITAFSVDICNRVYLSGWGREWGSTISSSPFFWGNTFGTVGMDVTPDAVQSETDGQDFYIMVMYGDASALDYGTFFGEQNYGTGYCGHDHVDGGTSRFDRMGNIYQSVCASCGNVGSPGFTPSCNEFPTTAGAAFEDNGGLIDSNWVCNNAVFRFSFAEDITVADFYADPIVCEGETVSFTNTGISTDYYWDFGDGSPIVTDENPTHVFPAPGEYDVTLWTIDSNTCNITDTIVKSITIQDQVSTDMADVTICLGEYVQIGVPNEPNHTYTWTPTTNLSGIDISNPMANPSTPTDYTLVIDDGVCLDTVWQTVNVIDIQYQIQALSDTTICYGSSVELDVQSSVPVSQVIWSLNPNFSPVLNPGGQSNITVNPLSQTTYYVMTRDSVCQVESVDSAVVEVDNPILEIDGPSTVCLGQDAQFELQLLNGTMSTIHWEPTNVIVSGQGTSTVEVQTANPVWLSVEVENSNTCLAEDSVYLQLSEVNASYTKTDLACHGICTGTIDLSYTGVGPFSFIWDTGLTGDQQSNLCAGDYKVTIMDVLGCLDSLEIQITEPPLLEAEITDFQNTGCNEQWNTGYATVTASGGTLPYEYIWTNGDTSITADSLYVGVFVVTVTDGNGCFARDSISISDPSALEIDVSSSPISCHDDCDAVASVEILVESIGPYTYIWNDGFDAAIDSNLCEGNYEVTVSDGNLCRRVASVIILNPDPLESNLSLSHQACHGDSADATLGTIGGTPYYTYEWSNGQSQNPAVDLPDGTYSVTVTDQHDCKEVLSFMVQSPDSIIIDTATTKVNCDIACNGTAIANATGGLEPYQFLWSNGDDEEFADSLCVGIHHLQLIDANNCLRTIEVNIEIEEDGVPIEATSNPQTIYSGASSNLQATPQDAYAYTWLPEEGLNNAEVANPLATPFSTTLYQVNVVDSFGCTNSDTTIVYVKDVICDWPYIFVPNAFSPNDDGNNDVLFVRGEMIEDLQFSVYNRWGELVFETNHIGQGWDGVYNGKKVDPAVFVYHLKATCVNKETFERKGNVTVVK